MLALTRRRRVRSKPATARTNVTPGSVKAAPVSPGRSSMYCTPIPSVAERRSAISNPFVSNTFPLCLGTLINGSPGRIGSAKSGSLNSSVHTASVKA